MAPSTPIRSVFSGMVSIDDCQLLQLSGISDERGSLTHFDPSGGFPFTPVRVFYLHSVPAGATRAGHALRDCHQLLVAVAGSFTLEIWDGKNSKRIHLSDPNHGVLVPPMIWREVSEFSPDAVCLVLASKPFSPEGYLRTKTGFLEAIQ